MATSLEGVTVNLAGFAKGFSWTSANHVPVNYVDVVGYDPTTPSVQTIAANLSVTPAS